MALPSKNQQANRKEMVATRSMPSIVPGNLEKAGKRPHTSDRPSQHYTFRALQVKPSNPLGQVDVPSADNPFGWIPAGGLRSKTSNLRKVDVDANLTAESILKSNHEVLSTSLSQMIEGVTPEVGCIRSRTKILTRVF